MNLFCNGCEYLSDNPNLRESCVHKKFCEKAFEKGCLSTELFKRLGVSKTDPDSIVLFTYDIDSRSNSFITGDSLKNLCTHISQWLSPLTCLFVPMGGPTICGEKFSATTLRNKFYYNDDEWVLTSLDGRTYSNVVKDAIEELWGEPICAYNEFQVAIIKTKDDYRNFDIQGSNEPKTNS